MIWRFFRQDVAWAGLILILALSFGEYRHWQLVQAGWQGQLRFLKESHTETESGQTGSLPAKLIELPEAWELYNQKQTLFVDASLPKEFNELHIAGAINVPMEDLIGQQEVAALKNVPKNQKILIYCSSSGCKRSVMVARMLFDLGYTQIRLFLGGFHAWDEAGYPMDTSR